MNIERKYVVDGSNRRIAVQIDINTFEKIEQVLEDYALVQLMKEADENEDALDLDQARNYYQNSENAKRLVAGIRAQPGSWWGPQGNVS